MSKLKLVIAAVIILLVLWLLVSWLTPPSRSDSDDNFTVDIGGDGFLVANFTSCLKLNEEGVPDGTFHGSVGDYEYSNAKNISYLDYAGGHNYLIVWKTAPEKYGFDTKSGIDQYISDYAPNENKTCFIEYSHENNRAYGIIVCREYSKISEVNLMYNVLGLSRNEFDLVYSKEAPSYTGSYHEHYHTVVPDRYTLSRTDPGAYYDHYEYGDNYDIDSYLESQGYD